MTTLIASTLHSADIVLAGKRKEARESYRLDVPLEFRDISRSELKPGIRIDGADDGRRDRRPYTLSAYDGRLWAPFVPEARRPKARHGEEILVADSEKTALTVAEFCEVLDGRLTREQWRILEVDPLRRRRGVMHGRDDWKPAGSFARLDDVAIKQLLWDNRAATEQELRDQADKLLIVDGKIWSEMPEPVLTLEASETERSVKLSTWRLGGYWYESLRQFRLDRADDMLDWANSRHGLMVVPLKHNYRPKGQEKARPESPSKIEHIVGQYEVYDPAILKRDDARLYLGSRLTDVLKKTLLLADLLPADAVDSFVALKQFKLTRRCCPVPTPELFTHLDRLNSSVVALSGLNSDQFDARNKVRSEISPLLSRWRSHDEAWHARQAMAVAPAAKAMTA